MNFAPKNAARRPAKLRAEIFKTGGIIKFLLASSSIIIFSGIKGAKIAPAVPMTKSNFPS